MTEEEEVDQILWEQRKKELAAEEMYDALKLVLEAIAWLQGPADLKWTGQPVLGRIQAALDKADGR